MRKQRNISKTKQKIGKQTCSESSSSSSAKRLNPDPLLSNLRGGLLPPSAGGEEIGAGSR